MTRAALLNVMNRRTFLKRCIAAGLFLGTGGWISRPGCRAALAPGEKALLKGFTIADAHAHPYQLHRAVTYDPSTPTVETMREVGMAACSFSAVGDAAKRGHRWGSPFRDTLDQLGLVTRLEKKGEVKIIRRYADIPSFTGPNSPPGALMAIEGGDAFEGDIGHLDAFYALGVRMVTLMHHVDNEIGFHQRSRSDGPLHPFGVRVVERMNELGMIVDVAHAKTKTLKAIQEVSAFPLVDSHTNPLPLGRTTSRPTRLRTWAEMERVAETGGVVCTWPLAYSGGSFSRITLGDWADEIVEMKARLGVEHVGLGTDGGGNLPRRVEGWTSIRSLPGLIRTLREAGLTLEDIAAFVGGNLLRVLSLCLSG